MNGTDNIAGYTLTVGTADFVITDSIAGYDPIIGNLTNGDFRSYKAQFIDPAMSSDYETGTGYWNASLSTLTRIPKTSSNGGALVDFGAGPKAIFLVDDYDSIQSMGTKFETSTAKVMTNVERDTIDSLAEGAFLDVGTIADTLAAGDDSRFGSVDIGDLTPATSIDGTELLPADQSGNGVSITAQEIAGTPYTATKSLALNRVRGYSDMSRMRASYSSTTNDTLVDLNPFTLFCSGANAGANNSAALFLSPLLALNTGTTNAGFAAVLHTDAPYAFVAATSELDQRWSFLITILPTGGEDFTIQVGFVVGIPTTQGIYFELTSASPNWFKCVKNGAGTTRVDSGVAAIVGSVTLRVAYSGAATESQFWIDGVALTPIDNTTRAPDALAALGMIASTRKTAGTAARGIIISHHLYDNAKDEVPYFS